jgi:8-oxo-dGTP diphosphatase
MEKDSNPGRYDISAAGHISAGEERIPAALRELKEELGITAEESDLEPVGVQKISYEKVFYKKPFRDRELADLYLFRKPVDTEELRLQKGEVDEVRWFPAEYVLQKARMEPEHREFCIYPDEVEKIIHALQK